MPDDATEETKARRKHGVDDAPNDDRFLAEDPLHQRLPTALQQQLEGLLVDETVETLAAWARAVRAHTGGGSIAVSDLCHADEETPHYAVTANETVHFRCFFDAVLLAALVEDPVDVHTVSPGGTPVALTAVETDAVTVAPESAVFSFGVSESLDTPADREPTHEDVYAAVCPYVRGFPTLAAYREWADEVPAATVAIPLADAKRVAGAYVG